MSENALHLARRLTRERDAAGAIAAFERHAADRPQEAAEALCEAAEACVTLGLGQERRIAFYRRAVAAAPRHAPAIATLSGQVPERSAERTKLLEQLVEADDPDGTERWRREVALGAHYRSVTKDLAAAAAVLERALAHVPGGDGAGQEAVLKVLVDIAKRAGNEADLARWKGEAAGARKAGGGTAKAVAKARAAEDEAALVEAQRAVAALFAQDVVIVNPDGTREAPPPPVEVPPLPPPPPPPAAARTGPEYAALLRDWIDGNRRQAKAAAERGEPAEERMQLGRACKLLIELGVRGFATPPEGMLALRFAGTRDVLERYVALREAEIAASALRYGDGSNDTYCFIVEPIEAAHLALLVDEVDLARRVLELPFAFVLSRKKLAALDRFWADYAAAFRAAVARTPFTPETHPLKGYLRHYAAYLGWIAAIAGGSPDAAERRAVEESFAGRNRDRRLLDAHGLDGDGADPVLWDFRLASIERLLARP